MLPLKNEQRDLELLIKIVRPKLGFEIKLSKSEYRSYPPVCLLLDITWYKNIAVYVNYLKMAN